MADNIFPTSYSPKVTPDGTDVVWSSDAVTNFNLTIASIALYTLTNSDTDSLSEGSTNLYYTEARVTTNATVVSLGTDKADKINVLELDNTTPFAPNADYEPATKKYVDDLGVNINGRTEKTSIDDVDEYIIYDNTGAINKKVKQSTLMNSLPLIPIAGTILTAFDAPTIRNTIVTSYTKLKEIEILISGTYTTYFNLWTNGGGNVAFGRIYKNGVAFGIERTNTNAYPGLQYIEDLTFIRGDLLQLYAYSDLGTQNTGVEDFNATYGLEIATVNLD